MTVLLYQCIKGMCTVFERHSWRLPTNSLVQTWQMLPSICCEDPPLSPPSAANNHCDTHTHKMDSKQQNYATTNKKPIKCSYITHMPLLPLATYVHNIKIYLSWHVILIDYCNTVIAKKLQIESGRIPVVEPEKAPQTKAEGPVLHISFMHM